MFLLDSVTRWEGGMTMFKRDIEKMKLLAAQGCPTCAIFTADLILIDGIRSQRKRVKIFITSNDGFLYPGGDMDVLGGMNRTPLRYLLKDPNGKAYNICYPSHQTYSTQRSSTFFLLYHLPPIQIRRHASTRPELGYRPAENSTLAILRLATLLPQDY
jgi:hypothetical protein